MVKKSNFTVDLLKILFILFVLFYHHPDYLGFIIFNMPKDLFSAFGNLGVAGFIILSGFGLTYSALREKRKKLNLSEFFKKRVVRILPLYYVALIVYIALHSKISLANFLSHIFLINVFIPEFAHNPGSLWFVGIIVQLYIVFPLLLHLLKKNPKLLAASSIAIFIITRYLISLNIYLKDSLGNWLPQFSFGMFLALIVYDNKSKLTLKSKIKYSFLLFVAGITLVSLMLLYRHNIITPDLAKIGAPLVHILYFIAGYHILGKINTLFKGQIKKILLTISYGTFCIFLFHRPIWAVFQKVWFSLGSENNTYKILFIIAVGLLTIFITGFYIQKSYDFLVRKLSRKQ